MKYSAKAFKGVSTVQGCSFLGLNVHFLSCLFTSVPFKNCELRNYISSRKVQWGTYTQHGFKRNSVKILALAVPLNFRFFKYSCSLTTRNKILVPYKILKNVSKRIKFKKNLHKFSYFVS